MLWKDKCNMLNYVSLFSSAGVGCYGFTQENFVCAASVELLSKRLNIQRINEKCKYATGYIAGDMSCANDYDSLLAEIARFKSKEKTKDIDVLIATPPCQGMSVANHKKRNELKRNSLVIGSIRAIGDIKPKYFILENVRAFLGAVCTDIDGVDKSVKSAIRSNLSSDYAIASKIVNFKNYGSNSSRTRTLVIGTRKDLKEVTPLDLFPDFRPAKTLHEVIGHLPSLPIMGMFDGHDIYHSFRPYKEHMLAWVKATPYGKSAFDNSKEKLKPHQIIDGVLVPNKNKNGDKYKRQVWENVAPCIHTRNDCLPSQNTVHPVDNRVFSIRELMLIMTIPKEFKWVGDAVLPDNSASHEEKAKFRKKHEFNTRQCIGEAVPTQVFREIATKIKRAELQSTKTSADIVKHIEYLKLSKFDNLMMFLEAADDTYTKSELFRICELANAKRLETAGFYTRQDICYSVIESLPDFKKGTIRILEPSVGVGNFLYLLAKKYEHKTIIIDCVDINKESLLLCEFLAKKYLPKKVTVNFIHDDFLLSKAIEKQKYDIVIGNPPYKKIVGERKLLKAYQVDCQNKATNNLFAFFIERAMKLADHVALIVPKALLNSPEYSLTRDLLAEQTISKIIDYNEKAFDVKIETISFIAHMRPTPKSHIVTVESYLQKRVFEQEQDYITTGQFDSWLLYRNDFFDAVSQTLDFGKFKAFRDRQITKRNSYADGNIRVIKSRNIGNNEIVEIDGYARYINDINGYAVGKYLNADVILVPNLTYNPRAARLPKNCITDGSAAILSSDMEILDEHIEYFSSDEFNQFYRIARNYGTRSMNIDRVSVDYFGVKKTA